MVDRYNIFGPAKLLFTRVDETDSYGVILNESVRTGLPVSFLGAGPSIPDDLVPATKDHIAELLLEGRGRWAAPSRRHETRTGEQHPAAAGAGGAGGASGNAAAYVSDHRTCRASERDSLILENLSQVRLIARRIHDWLPETVSLDDLVSTGVVGLITAIDNFDPSQNVKLKTYAEYKIRGAILDSLRALDWAPRQKRKKAKLIERLRSSAAEEQRLQPFSHRRTRSPSELSIGLEQNITSGWWKFAG